MHITHIEPRIVNEEIVDKIVCNKCGYEFIGPMFEENAKMEYHEFEGGGGYHSKIGDMSSWEFHLCDDCLIKLFDSFKIPVVIHSGSINMGYEDEN